MNSLEKYFGKPVNEITDEELNHLIRDNRQRIVSGKGYIKVKYSTHPKADPFGYVYEHILIAEEVLGKYLPDGTVVHHINNSPSDNKKSNLIICQDENYHRLLHKRERAHRECGHANWLKCKYCGEYDNANNMYAIIPNGRTSLTGYHTDCHARYDYRRKHGISKPDEASL